MDYNEYKRRRMTAEQRAEVRRGYAARYEAEKASGEFVYHHHCLLLLILGIPALLAGLVALRARKQRLLRRLAEHEWQASELHDADEQDK